MIDLTIVNYRLVLLIAIIVGVSAYYGLNWLNKTGKYVTKTLYRVVVSIFVGGFWVIFVPAFAFGFIIHYCAWSLAEWDWKGLWQDFVDWLKGLFKRKK